ncbi:MAG: hypothetical protein ABL921_08230 [Pirellula sp.]
MCKACNHIFTISSNPETTARNIDTFPFECPHCHHLFEGKEGMQGKRGKCENCSQVFEIKPTEPKPMSVSVPQSVKPKNTTPPKSKPLSRKIPPPKPSARPESVPSTSTTHDDGTVSVWDSISLPPVGSGMDSNPYSPSYSSEMNSLGSLKSVGLFGRCFKLAQKNLVMSAVMMLVVHFLSSILMMMFIAIPAGILILLRDTLAVPTWPAYAMVLFLMITAIPMLAVFYYFLPAYWNIADRSVRGQEVTFAAATEHADLAPQMFCWSIVTSIAPMILGSLVSVFFFALIYGAATSQSPALIVIAVLLFYLVTCLVFFLTATPFMLVPFALLDGVSFFESIALSLKLCFRNLGTFYLLTLVSMFIGMLAGLLSCGLLSTLGLTFVLMNHAAFYKLTSRKAF